MSESLGIEIKWTKKGCGNKIWFIRLKAEMQDFYIFLSFMLNTSLFKYERKAIHGKKKNRAENMSANYRMLCVTWETSVGCLVRTLNVNKEHFSV